MLNPLFNRHIRLLATDTAVLLSHALNRSISLLVNRRSRELCGNLISVNKNPRLRLEEPINILKTPVRSLGIEEICDGDEGEAYHSPDDPEAPFEVRDARGRDFGDHVVHLSKWRLVGAYFEQARAGGERLTIQFVAIAKLAPFVRISNALISVGYSHGTPKTPIPKLAKNTKKNVTATAP